jgi:ABC-type molybdate transport system substrate-binding protein
MKAIPIVFKKAAMVLICVWLFAGTAYGIEIKVMTSGGFTEAYNKLTPEFERAQGRDCIRSLDGGAPDSIPSRLQRG